MTIQEMHIAVNLGVQKIASFQVDNLLPQEIDHHLNISMDRFIKQRYSSFGNKYGTGFEQSQKRIDDLRNLVVDSKLTCSYLGETVGNGGEYYIDRCAIPQDYLFYVSAYLELGHKCGKVLILGTDFVTGTITKYYTPISLSPPSPGYVLTSIFTDNGNVISSNSELTYDDLINKNNYNQGYYPVSSQLEYSSFPIDDYHQTPTIHSNILLLASQGTQEITAQWTFGDTIENVEYPTSNSTAVQYNIRQIIPPEEEVISRTSITYIQHDDIYDLLVDPFNTTKRSSPKFTIQENFIDTYTDNTFISKFVYLKYIRKPKRLNIIAGVGCELAEHTHQEIVEIAIKSILGNIESPRYNTQSREVLESE
jgi:hypothetical protein